MRSDSARPIESAGDIVVNLAHLRPGSSSRERLPKDVPDLRRSRHALCSDSRSERSSTGTADFNASFVSWWRRAKFASPQWLA